MLSNKLKNSAIYWLINNVANRVRFVVEKKAFLMIFTFVTLELVVMNYCKIKMIT